MLKIKLTTIDISLPSGPLATINPLVGRHQRILTEQRKPMAQRFNSLLVDIIQDIAGSDWTKKTDLQKKAFVENMLSADRKYILTEARQLAKSHKPTFEFVHEYKDSSGVKKSIPLEIVLIDDDNRANQIQSIVVENKFISTDYDNEEDWTDEERDIVEHIRKLNRKGCFPTRPFRHTYDTYKEVLNNKFVEFDGEGMLEGIRFRFRMLDGVLEQKVDIRNSSSHTKILARKPRYKQAGEDGKYPENWKALESQDLDNLPLDAVDQIRNKMTYYEGEVDTIETFDNPDETKGDQVSVDLMSEISFFFPSGRV